MDGALNYVLVSYMTHRGAAMARRRLVPESTTLFPNCEVNVEWANPNINPWNVVGILITMILVVYHLEELRFSREKYLIVYDMAFRMNTDRTRNVEYNTRLLIYIYKRDTPTKGCLCLQAARFTIFLSHV